MDELVSPVLNCLHDPEVRVRLFASESLYNIVKVARGSIIPQFPRIFSALSRLVTGIYTYNEFICSPPCIHPPNCFCFYSTQMQMKIVKMVVNFLTDC